MSALTLVTVCLTLSGCGLFNKRGGSAPPGGGAPAPAPAVPDVEAATSDSSLPPQVNGLLAGQVLDEGHRRQGKAFIQVVDLRDSESGAPLEVETDREGYFTIKGLERGKPYRLTARVQEGERVLSGTVEARPPNPRLSIYVSEDNTTPETPAIPERPRAPGVGPAEGKDTGLPGPPSASLGAPAPAPPADPEREDPAIAEPVPAPPDPILGGPPYPSPPPPDPAPPDGASGGGLYEDGPPPDRARITINDDFMRAPTLPRVEVPPRAPSPPPELSIPSPPSRDEWMVPAPDTSPGSERELPDPPPGGHSAVPRGHTPVPSCALLGNRLDNFALFADDGRPWEFRRDRTGRLVLVDFWFSACGPCMAAVPHLRDLQRRYGSYGLQVVGIAYERGSLPEKMAKVSAVRGRYGINYTLLLGGGGQGPCPVQTQFEVTRFPTLVLLDEAGRVVWRREGLTERSRENLEYAIRRHLNLR